MLGGLGLLVLLTGATAFACCVDLDWPDCDEYFYIDYLTCAEQCGNKSGFNQCGTQYDFYPIPVPIQVETGYYMYDYYLIPQLCADIYACNPTDSACNIRGQTGAYLCTKGDWCSWSVTAGAYVWDPGCGEEEEE
jgi:hypothetical protein